MTIGEYPEHSSEAANKLGLLVAGDKSFKPNVTKFQRYMGIGKKIAIGLMTCFILFLAIHSVAVTSTIENIVWNVLGGGGAIYFAYRLTMYGKL